MVVPILKKQKYCSQTNSIIDISEMQLQYFAPDQKFDLFDHEYVKRYDAHFYPKRGEMNCREHANKVLFGVKGYIYSFAKAYAQNTKHNENDHLIITFSGYDDRTGLKFLLDMAQYSNSNTNASESIIDDYELLMEKYNEICSV